MNTFTCLIGLSTIPEDLRKFFCYLIPKEKVLYLYFLKDYFFNILKLDYTQEDFINRLIENNPIVKTEPKNT